MKQVSVTIGFLPREKFHLAAKSLKSIYKHTHIPFNLIVIDCNTPTNYLNEMKKILEGKPNVKIIHTDNFLEPNQARNLILTNTKDDYIAFIENDCIVSDNWLSKLIVACEEFPAMVAIPLLLEGQSWRKKVHHDTKLAKIKTGESGGRIFYKFEENLDLLNRYKETERHKVWSIEMHVMLFQRRVFDIIGPFDETVLADTAYVDVSLALFKAGIPVVCEPCAQVNFYHPPPVYNDELPFYSFTWDMKKNAGSNHYLAKKWNIVNMHDTTSFVEDQNYRPQWHTWVMRKGPAKILRILKGNK